MYFFPLEINQSKINQSDRKTKYTCKVRSRLCGQNYP